MPGEIGLWRAVVLRAALDAAGVYALGPAAATVERGRADVAAWLDSEDFERVCLWAALPSGAIQRRLNVLMNRDPTRKPVGARWRGAF